MPKKEVQQVIFPQHFLFFRNKKINQRKNHKFQEWKINQKPEKLTGQAEETCEKSEPRSQKIDPKIK